MNAGLKELLISELLSNQISIPNFHRLRSVIDELDLSVIIQKIYDLNDEQVRKIAAQAPVMAKVDSLKNAQRNARFVSKLKNGFRKDRNNRVILVEGDSWFNYPVLLSDVIDWISMDKNLALYSLASGGDWLLNMLSARRYIEQLSTINPDVFIISGGGNDLVGNNRIAAMLDASGKSTQEYYNCKWAMKLMEKNGAAIDVERFASGLRFISKDFFALLMFFHLQYYHIFNGILTGGTGNPANTKFPGIRIITQGYDYAEPCRNLGFGLNPLKWYKPFARLFLGHGTWLKTPMDIRGVSSKEEQRDVVYSMIYLFNEMMIETGELFERITGRKCVFHIDSRGSVGRDGWTDELHPLPKNFKKTAMAFVSCIKDESPTGLVYDVLPKVP